MQGLSPPYLRIPSFASSLRDPPLEPLHRSFVLLNHLTELLTPIFPSRQGKSITASSSPRHREGVNISIQLRSIYPLTMSQGPLSSKLTAHQQAISRTFTIPTRCGGYPSYSLATKHFPSLLIPTGLIPNLQSNYRKQVAMRLRKGGREAQPQVGCRNLAPPASLSLPLSLQGLGIATS